ncbi:MAG: PepSY domain-containing protein [Hyphomicrobiaceae bacterium]
MDGSEPAMVMLMTRTIPAALALAGLLLMSAARADSLDPARGRALVEKGVILSLEQIMKMNESQLTGRIIEVELEQKRGVYLYEIKVLPPDGRYKELKIDARSGEILRRK